MLVRAYHATLWLLLCSLLLVQVLSFVWRQLQVAQHVHFGCDPRQSGLFFVGGSTNDEPFTDRSLVCSLVGRLYKPAQLATVLASADAGPKRDAASFIDGYRVIRRDGSAMTAQSRDHYANTCDQIATTLDGMIDACNAFGYNVSGVEFLRIVTNDDNVLVDLPTTLPVLVMPFWDNGLFSRFAIPSHDGRACVFRLLGKYGDPSLTTWRLHGIDRRTRDSTTASWLHVPNGVWRHGWFEDPASGSRWYADLFSTNAKDGLGILRRVFDTSASKETDCTSDATGCSGDSIKTLWGSDLYTVDVAKATTSVTIMDAHRNGLFYYDNVGAHQVWTVYRLEMVISNVYVAMLLFRWLAALVATHHSGLSIGVGALACSRSFHVLPIVLLPRVKLLWAAFWTAGCYFEGDQRSLSEAWFVVFPALAECCWLFFSLLNLLAKLQRRRVSDVLFGPTLLTLCLLHLLRSPIASSGVFGVSGRVIARVTSDEFDAMRLVDVFGKGVAFRLNGRFTAVFAFKLALLALNLVPLVWRSANTSPRSCVRAGVVRCEAERSLALRLACNGGLGRSPIYLKSSSAATAPHKLEAIVPLANGKRMTTNQQAEPQSLLPYEVARAGYVVLGLDALVSIKDWFWFLVSAPFRRVGIPMRHLRMVTFTVSEDGEPGVAQLSERPTMLRVTDERFDGVGAWQISLRPLR